MRRSDDPCKKLVTTTHEKLWWPGYVNADEASTYKPGEKHERKTLALRVMSLDMASATPKVSLGATESYKGSRVMSRSYKGSRPASMGRNGI